MGDWSERFANVRCICYITLCGDEDGSGASGITGITDIGLGGFGSSGTFLVMDKKQVRTRSRKRHSMARDAGTS